jgi:hypothetical protein
MIRKGLAVLITCTIILWAIYPGFADTVYRALGVHPNLLYSTLISLSGSLLAVIPYSVHILLTGLLAILVALVVHYRRVENDSKSESKCSMQDEEVFTVMRSAIIQRPVKVPRSNPESTLPPEKSEMTESGPPKGSKATQGAWIKGEICPKCGSPSPIGSTSCVSCGAGLIPTNNASEGTSSNLLFLNCWRCGKDNLPNAQRCFYCGARLSEKVRGE